MPTQKPCDPMVIAILKQLGDTEAVKELGERNLMLNPRMASETLKGSMSQPDMPASYSGDALRGGKKTDGVNYIVGTMLQQGATMRDITQRLVDTGKSETAARKHLMFLHKNGVKIFVNGTEYQKGQGITANDFLTVLEN